MTRRIRKALADTDQGFTLIELLVVIIIIGILAAIAIPVFLNQRKKAVDARLKSDLKSAATANETWVVDNVAQSDVASNIDGVLLRGTGPLKDYTPSPGTTTRVRSFGGGSTYCIYVYNAGASNAVDASRTFQYAAKGGGVLTATLNTPVPDNAACP